MKLAKTMAAFVNVSKVCALQAGELIIEHILNHFKNNRTIFSISYRIRIYISRLSLQYYVVFYSELKTWNSKDFITTRYVQN